MPRRRTLANDAPAPTALAVIYTRVSQDKTRGGRSCAEQESECRAFVERMGWTLHPRVYTDNDRSASKYATKTRDEWQELTAELERGRFDTLVVWEPSRATRDRRVWAALAGICEESEVKIAANGSVYDLTDPDQAFHLDLFFALAARESGTTAKRVQRSMAANAENGRPHGRLPYGYRRTYDDRTGSFIAQIPDEEPRTATGADLAITTYTRAGIVRRIFAELKSGTPLVTIERKLNAEGIPGPHLRKSAEDDERLPSRWRRSRIRAMALSPTYIGQRTYYSVVHDGKTWPALIDDETFFAVTNMLNAPDRIATRPSRAKHLLSYLARCRCGAPLQAMLTGNTQTSRMIYRCAERLCSRIDMADLDEFVKAAVVEWLASTDLLSLILDDDTDTNAAHARAEAEQLRAKLDMERKILDDPHADVPASFYRREAALVEAIADADKRARPRMPVALRRITGDDPAAAWAGMELPARREFLRLAFDVRVAGKDRSGIPVIERVTVTPLLGAD